MQNITFIAFQFNQKQDMIKKIILQFQKNCTYKKIKQFFIHTYICIQKSIYIYIYQRFRFQKKKKLLLQKDNIIILIYGHVDNSI